MIRIRRSHQRGHFRNHWLDARFSFSFGDWRDPEVDGFSDLLVLNDDLVAPAGGFAEHGHQDVEVMSYPLEGAVEHRDSLGNVATMRPGDVHLMRAGHGIRHSEMNASSSEPERHLQWWIKPATKGLEPGYQRIHVGAADMHNQWRLLAAPEATQGVLTIAQDARVYAARVGGVALTHPLRADRRAYLHVVRGALTLEGQLLEAGDAALIDGSDGVTVHGSVDGPAEALLFDLR
ncbi:MAG TPA: pirin family protein [Burkholderiaceae bacterium]|nr:pirin family protein [Burkholderiaceae bacterium]